MLQFYISAISINVEIDAEETFQKNQKSMDKLLFYFIIINLQVQMQFFNQFENELQTSKTSIQNIFYF